MIKILAYKILSIFFGVVRETFQNVRAEAHGWNSRSPGCHRRGCLMTVRWIRGFMQRGNFHDSTPASRVVFPQCHTQASISLTLLAGKGFGQLLVRGLV